jgi:hypothetical protein
MGGIGRRVKVERLGEERGVEEVMETRRLWDSTSRMVVFVVVMSFCIGCIERGENYAYPHVLE